MSRSERLLDLMHLLRLHRFPVSGERLADELGVSVRTLYRDIATLQAQGADIVGTPGRGYLLKPGFLLPPLMFTEEEIEALVLGTRWVAARTDPALSRAGASALARIAAVLPADLREHLEQTGLFVPARRPGGQDAGAVVPSATTAPVLPRMREAIREELKVRIAYRDERGAESERVIWPIAIAFFEQVQMIVAWCELRQDYRNFRIDRIVRLALTVDRYPRSRHELLPEWRKANGIPEPAWQP
ncbi:MAG TPA: YafY family protein [Thermomicrobiales bacterium]|nr:YafY family protein [Thermomicrobiales bacterium]